MTGHDEDLKALFEEARFQDGQWTPSFERVLAGPVRPPRRRAGLVALATVALAALVAVVWLDSRPEEAAPNGSLTVNLRMPTDFLLDVLGAETLRSVPSIGSANDWFPPTMATKGSSL